jgi:hypothetical protein
VEIVRQEVVLALPPGQEVRLLYHTTLAGTHVNDGLFR